MKIFKMGVPSSATETKRLSEIHYLKDRIEEHGQNILLNSRYNQRVDYSNQIFNFVKSKDYLDKTTHFVKTTVHNSFPNYETLSEKLIKNVQMKSQVLSKNVYVNPNFKPQIPTVHINPNIYAKPLIHINPKVMHNITSLNQNLRNSVSTINANTAKTSIDNNTNASTINVNTTKTSMDNNKPTNMKRAIYVNPTLLKKLSSKEKSAESKESVTVERPVCSRLKPVKNTDNQKISPKKVSNSSILLLSRRKLVRVARSTKTTSRTFLISPYKLSKPAELIGRKDDKTKIKPINNALHFMSKSNLSKLRINKSNNNSKMSKYKIDRTISKVKKTNLSEKGKVLESTEKLVTISGIVYKASKNKLIRKNSLKRKRSLNGKNDKPSVAVYAKKQRISKDILNSSLGINTNNKTRFRFNTSLKTTYKNSISNKAKQRSIRILRNKMHKNNQPCLIFQRFGSCPNYENGKCLKRHDKKQVSLCKNFLQGKCFLDKCSLSHDVGPEKMPTCKYFLDGCCTRDDCPYLHVKVSSNTSICIDFLQGYCAKGTKCQRRHEYLCPEFNKSGNCSKGECCPYPHKSHFSNSEKSIKYSNKMRDVQKITLPTKNSSEISNTESRLRYYDMNDSSTEYVEKKKKIPTIDRTKQIQINEINKVLAEENEFTLDETVCHSNNKKKRVSTGSYIPIDIF